MGVSLKCACALQLLLWRQVCLSADNHVALLFMGGSRRGLSIRLSGLPLEPRCPDNQGSTVHPYGSYA